MIIILNAIGLIVLLFLILTSELNFKDLKFATYFGLFALLSAITFFTLTRNQDNEETKPLQEKTKK